ncbi:probable disease resistance RPP8-like protein 4 [Macadamia integrifolia]|uniref:probable disease resistance RPP8-like protein 4 n=1 Tax=Macadamia integrifolia TaxID=60698 RepID=UPI001C4ECA40|nr:probable disease resistance RPP8-like protein 4 [Macadamia integrifolia]
MNMRGLLCLTIFGEDDKMLPTLNPFSPPLFMTELCLCGRLVDLPDWIGSMVSLTKLKLGNSFLPEEAISVLQFLPNLNHLNLINACDTKQIGKEFRLVGGFPKLEALIITSKNLFEWTEIKKEALPSLAYLNFHNCSRLMSLPEGLQYVTTLKVLQMLPLHPDLEQKLKPGGGKENNKIKHIPQKHFFSPSALTWVTLE